MDTVTIVDAKNNLPKLIHTAEAGGDIHISRHGRPVAVLISEERYQQFFQSGQGVFDAILNWRDQHPAVLLDDAEIDSWRDHSPAREFSWD